MKPSVITYWQTTEDERTFFEYLKSTGNIIVFPVGKHRTEFELKSQAFDQYLSSDWQSFFCTLADYEEDVIITSVEEAGKEGFTVSPILSPVIGYQSGILSDRRLTPANAFAYWKTLAGEGESRRVVDKSHGFVKWGKGVFRWLRRHAQHRLEGKSLPMTERVTNAIAEGLEVVNY